MVDAIQAADTTLADANLPTYTEAMRMLLALAKASGAARSVDTHTVFKAWRMLDRWSITSGCMRPEYVSTPQEAVAPAPATINSTGAHNGHHPDAV